MPALLVVAFVVVPLVEVYVLIQVGQVIGGLPAVALLLAISLFGAWLVRREGVRAWRGLRAALSRGQAPGREAADAGLVLVGGALLLTPGFVTDAVGLLLVLPPTRALARRLLFRLALRRAVGGRLADALSARPRPRPQGEVKSPGGVVDGEVINPAVADDEKKPPRH